MVRKTADLPIHQNNKKVQSAEGQRIVMVVHICYDNDEPGQQAAQRISRELTEKNIWHEIYDPKQKDWNEDLLLWRKEGR